MLLLSLGVFAKPYDHSLGFCGGNFNGFSYKTLAKEHFAFQMDLGVEITVFEDVYGIFKVNPLFMYQGTMYQNNICSIDWFCGAGPSLGFMTTELGRYNGCFGGEFGLNGILGIEFAFSKALALSFDFRPGYGLYYGDERYYYTTTNYEYNYWSKTYYTYTTSHTSYEFGLQHFFDWGFQLGLRFYL